MRRALRRRRSDGMVELALEGRLRALSRRAAAVAGLAPAAVLTVAALVAVLPLAALALPGAIVGGAVGSAVWCRGWRAARRGAAVLRGPGAA
jgi:hypothetical protein